MKGNFPEQVVIGIMTCPKYQHRANGIRNTWLKSVPPNVRVLFVYGRSGYPESLEGDCLYLDCPEAYEKLPEKVYRFFSYCVANFEFDYIFKTDDDSFIDMDKFLAFDKQDSDYIGLFKGMGKDEMLARTWHYGKCTDKSFEVPYEGSFDYEWARGGGYFLSKKAVHFLTGNASLSYQNHLYEDKMVGELLTREASISILRAHYIEMGVLNPMPPHNMTYVQDALQSIQRLERENEHLRNSLK